MSARAILIDISDTLLQPDGTLVPLAVASVAELRRVGLEVFLVSNNTYVDRLQELFGLPKDRILFPAFVGGKKGTGKFVEHVSATLGIPKNEILYLGDVEQDMWEAMRGNVLFLRAAWSTHKKASKYGLPFNSIVRLVKAVKAWFIKDPLWYFKLDTVDNGGFGVHYRALMDPDLAKNSGIQKLLKENVRDINKEKHLTGHLLASISLEGLHLKDANGKPPIVCLYPGHDGAQTGSLDLFARLSGWIFKSDFIPDLIIRHKVSQKSAFARYKGQPLTIQNQLSTIVLNTKRKADIVNRRILIVDDFTTQGYGFETARNLLLNAGAAEVFCISVGKYGFTTNVFSSENGRAFDSFEIDTLTEEDLEKQTMRGEFDPNALENF